MRRLAPLALFVAATACATSPQATPPQAGAPSSGVRGTTAPEVWADSVLATLPLRDKVAQMVWPWMLGDYAPEGSADWERLAGWVERDHVGGVIVSVGPPLEIAEKLNAMQRRSRLPLLVGADFETGVGFRVRAGYFLPNAIDLGGATVFAPNMALGATRDTMLAHQQGRVTAREGRALGVHVTFSPVLDVNNNADNPVIGPRSFGEDPALVAAMGRAFIRGAQEAGMIATAKHFPGHGDTDVNSHLALPSVTASRARLDSVELVPFRAAVDAGVGAIMTFHGAMPALDPSGVPGTLSSRVLVDLLRQDMRFQGLVISDAMDMRGVLDQFGAAEATKRAVAAGTDVLLQPVNVQQTIDAVLAGIQEGRFDERRIDQSVRRILQAKARLGLPRQRLVSLDSVRAIVGIPAHLAQARTIAERSITLVRDEGGRLPLRAAAQGASAPRVLSITYTRRTDLGAGATFNAELRRQHPTLRAETVVAEDPGTNFDRLLRAADSADVVIIGSYATQGWDVAANTGVASPFLSFVRQLAGRGQGPVLVSFASPYVRRQVPEVRSYVVAWGGFPVSQAAAARALTGQIPFAGTLPVSIPGVATLGAGMGGGSR